jgi:hypothetical protein
MRLSLLVCVLVLIQPAMLWAKGQLEVGGLPSKTLRRGSPCVVRLSLAQRLPPPRVSLAGVSQRAYVSSAAVAFVVSGVNPSRRPVRLIVSQGEKPLLEASVYVGKARVFEPQKDLEANALELFVATSNGHVHYLVTAPAVPFRFTLEMSCAASGGSLHVARKQVKDGYVSGQFSAGRGVRLHLTAEFRPEAQPPMLLSNYVGANLDRERARRFLRGLAADVDVVMTP